MRDELIVERQLRMRQQGRIIVGLEDLLGCRMGQAAIADQDAEAAGI